MPSLIELNFKPLEYTGNSLKLLDQRLLPSQEIYVDCKSADQVIEAIQLMIVRGAPLIGIAGAWACCLASQEIVDQEKLQKKFEQIKTSRPTAVNLMKSVERMQSALKNLGIASLEAEAQKITDEDFEKCLAMSSQGLTVLPNKSEYACITHCNTGSLATGGLGTALGVFKLIHQQGKKLRVFATETRPYLQGARLTSWELTKYGIPTTLMPDSAAAFLMNTQKIDAVFVGADRIVANGDTANKIGTYALALAAKANQIPFYVVAPSTSIDLSLDSGKQIEIEQRIKQELIEFNGKLIAPESIDCFNPSFDITPGELITAFITEYGVIKPEKLMTQSQALG